MSDLSWMPTLNALLNASAAVFLLIGYWMIRSKRVEAHRAAMLGAFACSVLFLISYLVYHYLVGSKHFPGSGTVRTFYLLLLASHSILAAAVPVLALITLVRALRGRFDRHAAIARWTLPVWLYVSVTGVIVYWMLYRMTWTG